MRYFLPMLLCMALMFTGCSKEHPKEEVSEELGVRQALQDYQDAFNRGDALKLGGLWTEDASYIDPDSGAVIEGRDAIIEQYKSKFAVDGKEQIEIAHKKFTLTGPGSATEEGVLKLEHADHVFSQFAFKVFFVKQEGKWLISGVDEIEIETPPSNFEHLKQLAWLLGEWKDVDENSEIYFNTYWDKNKNFLLQQFSVQIYDQDQLEGHMLIAWDAAKKNIRCWVFDSDGTVGEGIWNKSDQGWSVPMQYTFGDGRKGMATNLYEHIQNDSYTFSSIDREADDEMLPNIDPVKVVRMVSQSLK